MVLNYLKAFLNYFLPLNKSNSIGIFSSPCTDSMIDINCMESEQSLQFSDFNTKQIGGENRCKKIQREQFDIIFMMLAMTTNNNQITVDFSLFEKN